MLPYLLSYLPVCLIWGLALLGAEDGGGYPMRGGVTHLGDVFAGPYWPRGLFLGGTLPICHCVGLGKLGGWVYSLGFPFGIPTRTASLFGSVFLLHWLLCSAVCCWVNWSCIPPLCLLLTHSWICLTLCCAVGTIPLKLCHGFTALD